MTPEGSLKRAVGDLLNAERIWWMPMNTGASVIDGRFVRFGTPGCADILASHKGRFLWLELKSPKGRQSEAQASFQERVEREGHTYLLVRSVDEVRDFLRQASAFKPASVRQENKA